MARTFIRQDTQIYSSDVFDDTIAPSLANFETNPLNAEQDFNNLRSMVAHLLNVQSGNWYDEISTPSTLETGAQRGVSDLNNALHLIEKKRVLRDVHSLVDVTVPAAQNWVVLGAGEIPTQTLAAVGNVTSLGTVVEPHPATFGSHSLAETAGPNALSPKNLLLIVDGSTRDPILSDNRQVYGLLQSESNTDGHTISDGAPNRVQISFVRQNATGNDLEAVPVADIENAVINYTTRERVRLEDLSEADFLRGAVVDIPTSSTENRQDVYDNQGTTPVNLTTNATLDLEGPGLVWSIRDDLEALLFRVLEGSAGGNSEVQFGADVDVFNNDAIINDFASGLRANTGGQRIDVGVNAGTIESTGANDLRLLGAGELYLDDGNQTGSTWAQTNGIKLSETTAEWDTFESRFGEVSLLDAITRAGLRTRVQAVVSANVAADNDVNGPGGANNLDIDLPAYDQVTFTTDVDVFLNGNLLRNGANAAANEDVYPGTDPSIGDLRFEFGLKGGGTKPDVLTVIVHGQ